MTSSSKILLKHNKGFNWTHNGTVFFKGFLFSKERKYLTGEEAISYLSLVKSLKDLKLLLAETDGLFSIVIQTEKTLLLACDRVRTFPLFYTENLVTDDPVSLEGQFDINPDAEHEFLHSGFVSGKDTLLQNLHQVQAGEAVEISDKLTTVFYHTLITKSWKDIPFEESFERLTQVLDNTFVDFIRSLEGRPVAVSLSGGYDSRLIAMMLKKHQYPKVICYTFGRKDNHELRNSKRTADALGFPWIFIEYNQETAKEYLHSPEFKEYYKYAARYTSMPFLWDYFSIIHLKNKKLIADDTIIVTGHAGDVIAGSRLKGRFTQGTSSHDILNLILNDNYHVGNGSISSFHIDKLTAQINTHNGSPVSIYENWDIKERQTKYTVNSTAVYDYFGYEFRMPYWDLRLMDFFKQLSPELKNYKRLYNAILRDVFFAPFDLNFEEELQTKRSEYQKQNIKDKIKKLIPFWLKKKLKKQEPPWHAHDILTLPMLNEIKNTELGKNLGLSYASIICSWYIEKLRKRKMDL